MFQRQEHKYLELLSLLGDQRHEWHYSQNDYKMGI